MFVLIKKNLKFFQKTPCTNHNQFFDRFLFFAHWSVEEKLFERIYLLKDSGDFVLDFDKNKNELEI